MADITIRYLDERVLSALKRRAEARNRPLQAELREALRNQVAGLSVPVQKGRRVGLRPTPTRGDDDTLVGRGGSQTRPPTEG